jgi:hypothetical protein
MVLLPVILASKSVSSWPSQAVVARYRGLVSNTSVQQSVLNQMYVFYILDVFIITLVAGAIFEVCMMCL